MPPNNETTHLRTAADIMTGQVISVASGTAVRDVAALMLSKRVSAVPVLDARQNLVGMVSEGDLLGRQDVDRVARQDWWLAMLQNKGAASKPTDLSGSRPVDEVMHAPVVTVEAATPLRSVAELLRAHDIKRVPVMQGDYVIGIVSRADLLRVVETATAPPATTSPGEGYLGMLMSMVGGGSRTSANPSPAQPQTKDAPRQTPSITADGFRGLVATSTQSKLDEKNNAEQAAILARTREVQTMLKTHVDDDMWKALLDHASSAASHGAKNFELLRFPCDLCADGGRKIDSDQDDWSTTLRGEAAEIYGRWERDLKAAGFGLRAQIMDYPGGMPGNVALFLGWQEAGG